MTQDGRNDRETPCLLKSMCTRCNPGVRGQPKSRQTAVVWSIPFPPFRWQASFEAGTNAPLIREEAPDRI